MKYKIGIIGLGYVGLPLAVELSKSFDVYGFDKNSSRIDELKNRIDNTNEITKHELQAALENRLKISSSQKELAECNVFIVTVPTPITTEKVPDLRPLELACETIGSLIKKNDKIFFESTVYPGCTEEYCVPIIERRSSLKFNKDFEVGYSPERINPGDKKHTLRSIKKVVSGSTENCLTVAKEIYGSVVDAGIYEATSIKVAEAAKVIENTQRDVNIAFMNELNAIFKKLNLNIYEVLEAAQTKWNFLPFKPGLVGGHCIGVDPYYLAQKAQEAGYHPEIILSGRRLNDDMGKYVAGEVVKLMIKRSLPVLGSNVLMLGITFKENCPDIRNTRAIDVYEEFQSYNVNVDVYDPWADSKEVRDEFGFDLIEEPSKKYHAVILTVAHEEFLEQELRSHLVDGGILYDVKGILDTNSIDARL